MRNEIKNLMHAAASKNYRLWYVAPEFVLDHYIKMGDKAKDPAMRKVIVDLIDDIQMTYMKNKAARPFRR